jgi:hypothetical protein
MATAVTGVTVASATSVTISYTGYTGGSTFTRYGAQSSTNGTTWLPATPTIVTPNATVAALTYTGLATGTTYYFRVCAMNVNTIVLDSVSAASNSVLVATVPAQVTAYTVAQKANTVGTLTISAVTAPAANGSAITGYNVQTSADNVNWSSEPVYATSSTYNVSGNLANGTLYYTRMAAVNIIGTGAYSSISKTATTCSIPSAAVTTWTVTGARALGASGSATFTWTGPANTSGAAILDYTISYTTDAINSPWTDIAGISGATYTTAPALLTNGTLYSFKIKPRNVVGFGPESTTKTATPATTPDAPSDLRLTSAVSSTTGINLSWTAGASTGGAATTYTLIRNTTLAANGTDVNATGATTTNSIATASTAVASLTAGNRYYFQVRAANIVGASTYTSPAFLAATLPAAPTIGAPALVTGSSTEISVAFTASSGTPAIANYMVTAYDNSGLATGQTATGSSFPIVVSGLTGGSTYKFKVQAATLDASNAPQYGAASAFSAVIVPGIVPGLPQGALAVSAQTSSAITINGFSKPSELDRGSYADITGYVVDRSLNGTTWTNASSVVAATATSYAFSGLVANTGYWLRIAAKNASGTGAYRYLVTSGDDTVAPAPAPAPAPTGTLPSAASLSSSTLASVSNGDGTTTLTVSYTAIAGATYRAVPYKIGTTEMTASADVTPGAGAKTLSVTVPDSTAYTVKVASVGTYGINYSVATSMIYLNKSVAAPSGKTYYYSTSSFTAGILQYTDVDIAAAVFSLDTVNGSPAWKITVGEQADYLVGVRVVILGPNAVAIINDNIVASPRAYLFGSGSGNSDINSYSYLRDIGVTNGSYMLFAAGETYTRAANNNTEWNLDRAVTMKGVGSGNKAKLSFLYPGGWIIHYLVSNIAMENIECNGNNLTRSSVFFKSSPASNPLTLTENLSFKDVDFKGMGSKALDFHYNRAITFDGCTIDAPSNSSTIAFTSCKDIVIKNSTIGCGAWGTFSFLTSDGPNYLWNNNTSTLWPGAGEAQADYEARRLAALNNSNIDMTDPSNNFLDSSNNVAPYVYIYLYKYVTAAGNLRLGLPANLRDLNDITTEYQVSLPYTELRLPAAFRYEYSKPDAVVNFNFPYKNVAMSTSHSTIALAHPQLGSSATVTDLSTSARIYPAGYEVAPGAPSVTVTRHADGGRVDLSWTAIDANDEDGMDATAPYSVSVSPSAGTASVSGTTASVTGLTNGVEYTFTVTAKNAAGLESSGSVSKTPAKKPDAPTGLSLTARDTAIEVSCGGPSDPATIGGASIAGYRVNVYDASENGTLIKTVDYLSLPVVVDLSDGTAYYFSAQVKNNILDDYSAESSRSGPLATVTSPGPPSVNAPTAGYKSIGLTWSAPDISGDNTSFTYKVKRVNGATEVVEDVSGSTSHTLSGLTGGVEYTVYVAAIGNIDTAIGSYSPGQTVMPYSEPDAPAAPSVMFATSTTITLNWDAPAANGADIDRYKIRQNGSTLIDDILGTIYIVTDLTPNTSYMFTVAAYNIGGWSENSDVFTAYTTASAPTIALLTGKSRNLSVSITPPSPSTGITSYGVKVDGVDVAADVSGASAKFSVASTKTGSISVKVYAKTAAGDGAESDAVTINVPIADPTDQASIQEAVQEAITAGNVEVPVYVPNEPAPVMAPILDTANQEAANAIPPNTVVMIAGSEDQPLKNNAPVVAVKMDNLSDDAGVKSAFNTARATGLNRVAITEERQVGTESVAVTTVMSVSETETGPSAPDVTVSNNTVPANDPTYTATTTIRQSESSGLPVGGSIGMSVEPMPYSENDLTQKEPVKKEGISITFKILDICGNVIKDGFNLKLRVNVPSKAGAGQLDRWHYHDDDKKYHLEAPAIETPINSGFFEFIQDHNENVVLVPEGSDPNAAPPLCFLGNARVLTPAGYRRIDRLRVGDEVKTADGRTVAIQRVIAKEYAPMRSTNPYVIPVGQFGATEEVLISPEHCVAIAGRGMIKACKLGLEQRKMSAPFTYYNLELPCHDTDNLVVGGVEVESLANMIRIEVTKEQFISMMRARYGTLTPDLLARAARACFFTAEGKVNMPVFKRASK